VLIDFTEEQLAVRDTVRRFGETEIMPARRRLEADRELFAALSRRIAKLGLLEIVQFDEEGNDQRVPGSYVTLGVACEELGRYDTSLAQVVSGAGCGLQRGRGGLRHPGHADHRPAGARRRARYRREELGHRHAGGGLSVEQRLRDVIGFELADGASEIMKLIIARRMFGRAVAG
jgi:alkylation response protein AidB-like acyl-CoA dehydrogenase